MPTEEDKQQLAEAAAAAAVQQQAPAAAAANAAANGEENGAAADDALKSEISLVFEIALKRNFTVTFEVNVSVIYVHCILLD